MYLTTDVVSSDHTLVTAIGEEGDNLQLFDYVLIASKGQKWIGQVIAPNLNISNSGGQFDPSLLYAIKLSQQNPSVRMAETVEAWHIRLYGEYEGNALRTLRRRPKPSADVKRLDRETTDSVLNLPRLQQDDKQKASNVVGYLLNAENVPLCVDPKILTHHILVSGGTGSGKRNTSANVIHQASRFGFTVFLYDAKPDYRKMNKENTDKSVESIWKGFDSYHVKPCPPHNLKRIAIYGVGTPGRTKNYEGYQKVIGFRASDFEPYLFASLFFDPVVNTNQYEEFASVCADLKYGSDDHGKGEEKERVFKVKDVIDEVTRRWKAYIEQEKNENKGTQRDPNQKTIHPKTADAIIRKVNRLKGSMKWLDAVDEKVNADTDEKSKTVFDRDEGKVETFAPKDFVGEEAGVIVHVDCADIDARTYALFLARFMEINQRYLAQRRRDKKENEKKLTGIVEFVDEAHRLFTNDTRYSEMLGREFGRVMVEGRSLGHGMVLSLQNASQVPSLILNNINTHIIMKQNNLVVAKAATQTLGDGFAEQSLFLSPGHALCRMFESGMTVLAQLAPSPFELERSDNVS